MLRNNSFTGIQPLLRLSNLQVLNLDGNAILDISALSPAAPAALPLPLLSQLSVDGSRLKVASLPRLGSLSYLQASHNCLAAADVPASATEVYWGGQRALVSGVCPPYAP
ncbi:MAG: leucine-rich repeat domain-containing protein [Candidatus Thiothrix singaporensis]|uniref:Leucine-rich repeat domain-containing protein n=1 Tax=Candidatus Thiothrix singaporensis TaxID=2799669 RepID=A0A7L6ANM8_9GAMM|nr:MAG: leucine-rich repeat domain-containing protein [Candidatus Thiothrix singaporensis]